MLKLGGAFFSGMIVGAACYHLYIKYSAYREQFNILSIKNTPPYQLNKIDELKNLEDSLQKAIEKEITNKFIERGNSKYMRMENLGISEERRSIMDKIDLFFDEEIRKNLGINEYTESDYMRASNYTKIFDYNLDKDSFKGGVIKVNKSQKYNTNILF